MKNMPGPPALSKTEAHADTVKPEHSAESRAPYPDTAPHPLYSVQLYHRPVLPSPHTALSPWSSTGRYGSLPLPSEAPRSGSGQYRWSCLPYRSRCRCFPVKSSDQTLNPHLPVCPLRSLPAPRRRPRWPTVRKGSFPPDRKMPSPQA